MARACRSSEHIILSSYTSFLLPLVAIAVVQITVSTSGLQRAPWCQDSRATKKLTQYEFLFEAPTFDASYSGAVWHRYAVIAESPHTFRAVPYL